MEASKNRKSRIVMTGGHAATTAYAVVEEINRQEKNWEMFWIGSKVAVEGSSMKTLEHELFSGTEVKYYEIYTGRLQRKFSFYTVPSLLKIPVGMLQSLFLILKIRPKIVLSFGGFASIPVVIAAKILGVKIILHEQTVAAGRASIFTSKLADKIALSRASSKKFFPEDKCVVTGNPMSSEVRSVAVKKQIGTPPCIFVTGGSRGSQNINNAVEEILPTLLGKYKVIHQTGNLDVEHFRLIRASLPDVQRRRYEVFPRVGPYDMSEIYTKADVVVARSGANTVSEVMYTKRPTVFIPLPISYLDEQTKNAEFAQDFGIGEILPQSNLDSKNLMEKIDYLVKNYANIVKKISTKKSPDVDATEAIVNLISQEIK